MRRYVGEPRRTRLAELLARGVRLVGTGHVHRFLAHDAGGVHHVWAPSTWALIPDHVQPVIGVKRTGLVDHVLAGDGSVTSTFVSRPTSLGHDHQAPACAAPSPWPPADPADLTTHEVRDSPTPIA